MGRAWVEKLDETLRRLNDQAPDGGTLVACLIWTDSTAWGEVENLVQGQGGMVRHRVDVVPGLTAALPVRSLGAVASSEHVLQVEADIGYTAF